MKKTIRGVGIGIFLTGAFFTAYDSLFAPSTDKEIALLEQQLRDSEAKVKHLQEVAKIEENAKTETNNEEKNKNKDTVKKNDASDVAKGEATKADSSKTDTKPKDDAVKGSIYIYENVSLYDIGKQAEDAGIIENGRELELYLYKPEYARSIQIGQFELSSDMTLEEMALILTGKK